MNTTEDLENLAESISNITVYDSPAAVIAKELAEKDDEALRAIKAAFAFYEKHQSPELDWPPYYVKRKNGPTWENIVLVPDQDGETNYSYYRGIWINLHFVSGHVSVVVDGEVDRVFEDHSELVKYLEAEDKTVFEKLVVEHVTPYLELLTEFFEETKS